jgi:hypothetical protein
MLQDSRFRLRPVLAATVAVLFAVVACDQDQLTGPEQMTASQQTIGSDAGSLGKITVGTEVSEWEVGSGQFNGEFVTAEGQGVQLGLRAQERFEGLLDVTPANGDRVGVYEAETGDTGGNNATWNYDFHVDLSDATGRHAGKTLSDYRLVLEQDFTEENLFGELGSDPVELPMVAGICDTDTFDADDLCQQSWNPGFGNDDFDPDVEDAYTLRLVLTPETFNAQPLAVVIQVDVTD